MSRILCLIDSLGAGGAERQLSYLAILLKEAGHEVKMVAFTKTNKFYEPFLCSGGIKPIYNKSGINRFRRIFEIAKIVRVFKPDLTVAYKDGVCMSAVLAKVFGNYNLAVSERSSTPTLSKLQKIKLFLFRFADYIVPNSYTQAHYLKTFSPSLSSKIKVIGNTVDVDLFHPAENKRYNNIPQVVTTARVKRIKNIIKYLQAIAIVKDKGIICHFDWYGKTDQGDNYINEVKAEIRRLGIDDYITFHPAINDVAIVYRNADIFCLPSLIEGFPNVICEAMASGLPVVCSNICDNPYIVESGVNGFLFDPDNPEDIAEKILAMLRFPESDKIVMGIDNRKKIVDMCSPEKFTENYLALLNR